MPNNLQTKILNYINSVPGAWCQNIEQASKRGCADIIACFNGQSVAIEVKDCKGDKLSALQFEDLRKHGLAGGIGCVVASECNVKANANFIHQQNEDCQKNGIEVALIGVLTLEEFKEVFNGNGFTN